MTQRQEAFLKAVGERIHTARKERGFTQTELANKIGFGQQLITKYETGQRNIPLLNLLMIADALEVPLQKLLPSRKK